MIAINSVHLVGGMRRHEVIPTRDRPPHTTKEVTVNMTRQPTTTSGRKAPS